MEKIWESPGPYFISPKERLVTKPCVGPNNLQEHTTFISRSMSTIMKARNILPYILQQDLTSHFQPSNFKRFPLWSHTTQYVQVPGWRCPSSSWCLCLSNWPVRCRLGFCGKPYTTSTMSDLNINSTLRMNSGYDMPMLGYGVSRLNFPFVTTADHYRIGLPNVRNSASIPVSCSQVLTDIPKKTNGSGRKTSQPRIQGRLSSRMSFPSLWNGYLAH